MAALVIYGASDDLIEIEGLIRDELAAPYDRPGIVTIKVDDTCWAHVGIEYTDDGIWRIGDRDGGAALSGVVIIPARAEHDEDVPDDEHGCPGYSDKIVIPMHGIDSYRISVSVKAVPMPDTPTPAPALTDEQSAQDFVIRGVDHATFDIWLAAVIARAKREERERIATAVAGLITECGRKRERRPDPRLDLGYRVGESDGLSRAYLAVTEPEAPNDPH